MVQLEQYYKKYETNKTNKQTNYIKADSFVEVLQALTT